MNATMLSLLFLLIPEAPLDNVTQNDIICLATNIYHESRGENIYGKIAVANVAINRAKSDLFPQNNVCDVIKAFKYVKRRTGYRKVCQFSWYCDGKKDIVNLDTNPPKVQYKKKEFEKYMILAALIAYGYVPDITHGALFYHADYVSPRWKNSYTMVAKYDNQLFYRTANGSL
jgi:spore germination cell wall hydrolase CwlJ-like protein